MENYKETISLEDYNASYAENKQLRRELRDAHILIGFIIKEKFQGEMKLSRRSFKDFTYHDFQLLRWYDEKDDLDVYAIKKTNTV